MIERLHASAGSGKTYRLTRRFLNLLMKSGKAASACGPQPGGEYGAQSILAITFTNKAATEMKQRVLDALKTVALGLPDPDFNTPVQRASAREWLERTLRHLQNLNIRTIDSLLTQLARIFALELGLPPDFETSLDQAEVFQDLFDAATGAALVDPAELDRMFAAMADALTLEQGREGFWLAAEVEKRLRRVFDHCVEHGPLPLEDVAALRARMDALRRELQDSAQALRAALAAAGAQPVSNMLKLLDTVSGGTPVSALNDSAYAGKPGLADCLKKASQGAVTPDMDALYRRFCAAYHQARNRGALLDKALTWHPFVEFGLILVRAFDTYRSQRGVALLAQMPAGVARLLAQGDGVPEAYCRLGSRLNHLLIDEFQDTSASQWNVLAQLAQECLSKGGSLFYVGDVKQAIYGWRGGDAALFEAAGADPELTRIAPLHTETLGRNWRSTPQVVGFNNSVFSTLTDPDTSRMVIDAMLKDAPEAVRQHTGQALRDAFHQVEQDVPPDHADRQGLVRLTRLRADKADEYRQEAKAALERLFQDDLLRRRPPGDIAVLTRTNTDAAQVAQWLVDLGVPVVTENSLRLAEHPIIQGAVSFLAFLDYPPDNMALWGFLSCRELFCRSQNVSRQALTDWLAAQSRGLLYRKFRRDFPEPWARLMEPFLKGAGPASPYDLVQELFDACGVFQAYPEDEVFLRRFLELVHNAEAHGHGSISAFLDFWRAKGRDEKIPQPEDAAAVRVLTMHKAKGLEFPVVVVPFHMFSHNAPDELACFTEDGTALACPVSKEMGPAYHESAARTLLEQINLLYVAWTRPEEELHIFLHAGERMANRYPIAKAADLMLAAAGIPTEQEEAVFGTPPPSQATLLPWEPAPSPGLEPAAPAAPTGAQQPLAWLPGLKILRHELGDPQERLRRGERLRGVAMHKALEAFRPGQDPLEAVSRAMAAVGWLGGEDQALELAVGLEWLAGQDYFEACARHGLREVELLDADGGVHRPDLLAFTPEETLVVDYKTGGEDPAHADQVRRYLGLAAGLPQAQGRPARGLIAYLDRRVTRLVQPEQPQ